MSISEPMGVKILGQQKVTEPDGKGGFIQVWKVHYESPSGVQSWVEVPASLHTIENVAALIKAELDVIEGVHALS